MVVVVLHLPRTSNPFGADKQSEILAGLVGLDPGWVAHQQEAAVGDRRSTGCKVAYRVATTCTDIRETELKFIEFAPLASNQRDPLQDHLLSTPPTHDCVYSSTGPELSNKPTT